MTTVEEQRAGQPVPTAILEGSRLDWKPPAGGRPAELGAALWREAVAAGGDDRPLYWSRLRLAAALRAAGEDTTAFELASRGMAGPGPLGDILVTGFDPFRLDDDIRHGNPSGAIALALSGQVIAGRRISTMIFPVRYADFDAGLVERVLDRYIGRVAWIVTVSQGRTDQFDLEVWNGRRRSTGRADNDGQFGGGSREQPLTAPRMPPGPEFIQATLPFEAMAEETGGAYPVRVNTAITQLTPGGVPREGTEPQPGALAVAGSGGGFLSNEIAYRNTRLLAERRSRTLGGHVHTPVLPVPPGEELTGAEMAQARADIVGQFTDILRSGLGAPAG